MVWAQHLTEIGIKFAFYSAQNEQIKSVFSSSILVVIHCRIDDHALQPKRQSKIRQPKLDVQETDLESDHDVDSSSEEPENENESNNFDALNAIIQGIISGIV